jgi:hypothetical protein
LCSIPAYTGQFRALESLKSVIKLRTTLTLRDVSHSAEAVAVDHTVVTPRGLVGGTNVSDEHIVSIF